jgi:uncharacterized protein YutD
MNKGLIIKKVISLEERVGRIEENMVTKKEFNARFDQVMNTLDHLVGKYDNNEQERTVLHNDLKKLSTMS